MRYITRGALLAAAIAASFGTHAQEQPADAANYPVKPVRVVVPFPPGGTNDLIGRFIAQKLSERTGRQSIVDNRAGADGIIGSDAVAKAAPDGYTLLVVSVSYAMNPALHKLPFDPVKSFAPVAQIATGAVVLAVTPSLPVASVGQLVELARRRPGELNYASAGVGGVNHFSAELFKIATKTNMVHVPYKGGGPAMIDTIAGNVQVIFNALPSALTHIRSGKLKALGVGTTQRSAALPETPAIAETVPGYEATMWWGMLAPAGVPPAILTKLNGEINAILREPASAKRLEADGAQPVVGTPAAFGALVASDVTKWIKVAKSAGIAAH